MSSLTRLLALVRRTRLPAIIPDQDGREGDCVLLPLEVYERLSGSLNDPGKRPLAFSPEAFQAAPTSQIADPQPTKPTLSLQDLLQSEPHAEPKIPSSSIFPQSESLEDRFAFGLEDVKILPVVKQKTPPNQSILDEFGQTLA
ncbi:hypothetical protein KBD34_03855 [Patescibacteria group bacterium]|nr:hypothetical protein [Patescibacteria group bacterium]